MKVSEVMRKSISIGVFAFSVSVLNTNAAAIEFGDYSWDGTTNYVSNSASGLDWIRWSATDGMSIDSALTSFGNDGWRVASNAEMTGLYTDFFSGFSWGTDESLYQTNDSVTSFDGNDENYQIFMGLFGKTNMDQNCFENLNGYTCENNQQVKQYGNSTQALYGSDENGNGAYNTATVNDEYAIFSESSSWSKTYSEKATLSRDEGQFTSDYSYESYGVALVRGGSPTGSGDSESDPILPDPITQTATSPLPDNVVASDTAWSFVDVPSGDWSDPPIAYGFLYEMQGNSLFTDIFNIGSAFDYPLDIFSGDDFLGTFKNGDATFEFENGGVSSFSIVGFEPLVNPDDPNAFPIQLGFNTDTASFNQYALTREVPEPTPIALFGLGLAVLSLSRKNKRV